MKRILKTGTYKDKVSALSIYIRDNPKYSLKTIDSLLQLCVKNSRKNQMVAIDALKDVFVDVLLPPNQMEYF